MDAAEYLRVKEAAEALRRKADRARGAYEQGLKDLKERFGVNSLLEGEALLKKREKEEARLEKELDAEWEAFLEKYGALLESEE